MNKYKPYLLGTLTALSLWGLLWFGGKVHYYYRVLNATEHILINSHVQF
jgi:hypothetical protein